jgi:cytidyltransferase-like protein
MKVYTGGTFDLFHGGHIELLAACRDLAGPRGRVIVGLNSDAFVERYKGRLPAEPYAVRSANLYASGFVDAVVLNLGDEDSSIAIDVVRPDVIAIGDDWLDPEAIDPEARYLAQLGITRDWLYVRQLHVEYVPRTTGISTSALRSGLPMHPPT